MAALDDTFNADDLTETLKQLNALKSSKPKKTYRKWFFTFGVLVGAGAAIGAYESGLVDDVMEKFQ